MTMPMLDQAHKDDLYELGLVKSVTKMVTWCLRATKVAIFVE